MQLYSTKRMKLRIFPNDLRLQVQWKLRQWFIMQFLYFSKDGYSSYRYLYKFQISLAQMIDESNKEMLYILGVQQEAGDVVKYLQNPERIYFKVKWNVIQLDSEFMFEVESLNSWEDSSLSVEQDQLVKREEKTEDCGIDFIEFSENEILVDDNNEDDKEIMNNHNDKMKIKVQENDAGKQKQRVIFLTNTPWEPKKLTLEKRRAAHEQTQQFLDVVKKKKKHQSNGEEVVDHKKKLLAQSMGILNDKLTQSKKKKQKDSASSCSDGSDSESGGGDQSAMKSAGLYSQLRRLQVFKKELDQVYEDTYQLCMSLLHYMKDGTHTF